MRFFFFGSFLACDSKHDNTASWINHSKYCTQLLFPSSKCLSSLLRWPCWERSAFFSPAADSHHDHFNVILVSHTFRLVVSCFVHAIDSTPHSESVICFHLTCKFDAQMITFLKDAIFSLFSPPRFSTNLPYRTPAQWIQPNPITVSSRPNYHHFLHVLLTGF